MELLIVAAPAAHGSFGALLRAQRHRALLSQEELAARSGLSERTIRNLEANRVRVPRASTTRLLAKALGLNGPDREAFISARRRDRELEHAEGLSARGSGPTRLPDDSPAPLPVHVHGLAHGGDQLAHPDIPAASGELPVTVEITASAPVAGTGRTALVVYWADRVTRKFDDERSNANLRGFGNMSEIKDTRDGSNVAPATACSAQAAMHIGALVANALHNGTPAKAAVPNEEQASRSNPVPEASTATTAPTTGDPSTVRDEGRHGQRHGGQPKAQLADRARDRAQPRTAPRPPLVIIRPGALRTG